MKKVAVVIGATGVVGRSVVEQLGHSEHIKKVVSLTRRPVSYENNKIVNQVIDFDRLEDFYECFSGDLFFSCLGTTKKQAGSIEAQRLVDFEYQRRAARMAEGQNADHYLLVSSSGANANSGNAYLKMKGELEDCVTQMSFKQVSIFQPSLLLGDRADVRIGEKIGAALLPSVCKLPGLKKYRPIRGDQVAKKMVAVSQSEGKGVQYFVLDTIFS